MPAMKDFLLEKSYRPGVSAGCRMAIRKKEKAIMPKAEA